VSDEFENAAAVLKKAMLEFGEQSDAADAHFDALAKKLDALEKQLEADWGGFATAVKELAEAAEARAESLAKDAGEAAEAIDGLETTLGERQKTIEEGTSELEKGADLLKQAAEAMEIALEKAVDEGAEDPCEKVGKQADDALEGFQEVLGKATDFMKTEFVKDIQDNLDMLTLLTPASVNITNDNATWLSEAAQECAAKLSLAVEHVQAHGFEKGREHGPKTLSEAHEECSTAHQKKLEKLVQLLTEAQEQLTALKDEVDAKEEALKQPTPDFTEDASQVATAAKEADDALARVTTDLTEKGHMAS
jgi:hypothetical protein